MSIPDEYRTPEAQRTLANFLRAQGGVKVKSGIEHEKRVDYFKGKKLVECIQEAKKWPKSLPRLTEEEIIVQVADLLLQAGFFHRSEKVKEKRGYLKISQQTVFDSKGYYTWMYAGNMMWSNVATGLVIFAVIGFTLLPIWPDYAKRILWYLSVTFLISTLAFCLIRFLVFLVMWLFGYEFWIFPRLFDESLSFQDSFKPVYSFDKGTAGQGYYRIGLVLALAAGTYWAFTQPTEFDGFLHAQKEFIDDLYSGKLLADVAFDPREHMNQQHKKVPALEDLLKELEADEKAHITEKAEDFYDGENGSEMAYIPPVSEENDTENENESVESEKDSESEERNAEDAEESEDVDVDIDGSTTSEE